MSDRDGEASDVGREAVTPDAGAPDAGAPDVGAPEGGDPVCWLERVCPECGAFREEATSVACWRCGEQ